MPVGIVIASVVGVILMVWIIKRSRAEPQVEFRQDTMRYITLDPDRTKRNHEPLGQTQPAAQPEAPSTMAATEPGNAASASEQPDLQVAPKSVSADEADDAADSSFEIPNLLVNDER